MLSQILIFLLDTLLGLFFSCAAAAFFYATAARALPQSAITISRCTYRFRRTACTSGNSRI